MFTGIIEELGTITSLVDSRVVISASEVLQDVTMGASIAVNGCCLTVVNWGSDTWEADLSEETLDRTSLRSLKVGERVNLERPVRLNDRLGGHLVQGHVDAVGQVFLPAPNLRITMPSELLRYVVVKGSITVDGVSLTVVEVLSDGFTVALIPHTCEVTNLGALESGDLVNLEVDVMAKYAERLLVGHLSDSEHSTTKVDDADRQNEGVTDHE
ncbi:MAG: riboflavin synthase [Microthrixaceae bacterium]